MENILENIKTKGKIIILKGQSRYNVLRIACDNIAKEFQNLGYDTLVIDTTEIANIGDLVTILVPEMDDRGLFIFSYNALFHDVHNDTSFYDYLNYPVYGFIVDHPIFHRDRLLFSKSDKVFIGCVDKNHVEYIHHYHPNIKNTYFTPHFSFQSEEMIPYEKRRIDIYFPGTYTDIQTYSNNLKKLPEVFYNIAKAVIDMMLKNTKLTIEEALRRYLSLIKFKYSGSEFDELLSRISDADYYIRSYYRDLIVKAILDAGINLTVCGKGWEKVKEQDKHNCLNVIGTTGIDIEENVKLIADSRILLNVLPLFKNGTHERIFTAMLNKSVCLTDKSIYLEQNFENNREIVFYDLNHIKLLPKIIKDLLDHPEKAIQITENVYQKAASQYSYSNTAKCILSQMGLE